MKQKVRFYAGSNLEKLEILIDDIKICGCERNLTAIIICRV